MYKRQVDTVAADGLVAEDAHIVQTEHQALVVLRQAVVQIVDALGDVDVVARALGLLGRAVLERFIRERERRVHTHHALDHVGRIFLRKADEVNVLPVSYTHL